MSCLYHSRRNKYQIIQNKNKNNSIEAVIHLVCSNCSPLRVSIFPGTRRFRARATLSRLVPSISQCFPGEKRIFTNDQKKQHQWDHSTKWYEYVWIQVSTSFTPFHQLHSCIQKAFGETSVYQLVGPTKLNLQNCFTEIQSINPILLT